ncbi:LuxR C-terminal-related transcriptional regulator [Vibrio spartinae]|uniref:CsgBAC operon transcriptional regulatory protein n=1 Tax=Vibrio spartinae TaxID=1918945 RepID=A0A1N6M0E0_9VIBR|nr:LuxR C-terminal-related transcriptional regulator [Vibrio spartinae]QMV15659.1 CsgBAC operon transcriptional regulatory protein [Vibrio spartinae]SIO92904.1 CsgBAC operon transcriptional regulatory protein [Vibrio spartinae]
MKRSNYSRVLYVLYPDNQEPSMFYHEIEVALGQILPKIQPRQFMLSHQTDRHKILLFDYQQKEVLLSRLNMENALDLCLETVVVNVEKRLRTEELLQLGNLKGLFYRSDPLELIIAALREIREGQIYLPRHICSQLLHYYRHLFNNKNVSAAISLTSRELEILRCLKTGASNTQIADNLFISEFTVKSHLYQIFKKISVKNRTQATTWAKQNLVS